MHKPFSILLVLGALLLTSCKRSSSSDSTFMVYIPKNTGNPYFDPMIDGFKQAADEAKVSFEQIAPATADATSQLPLIKAQIQRGVKVIAISPNSPDALNQVFKEAMDKGVTVICVDSDLTGNEQYRTAGVLPTDPEQVGRGQIELLGSLIGYKGQFAILSATTDAPNQNEWIKWMKEALKDAKYKDMQLAEVVYGDDQPEKSTTEAAGSADEVPGFEGDYLADDGGCGGVCPSGRVGRQSIAGGRYGPGHTESNAAIHSERHDESLRPLEPQGRGICFRLPRRRDRDWQGEARARRQIPGRHDGRADVPGQGCHHHRAAVYFHQRQHRSVSFLGIDSLGIRSFNHATDRDSELVLPHPAAA